MLSYVMLLNPVFAPHSNLFFVPMSLVQQFGVRFVHFMPMTSSICMAWLVSKPQHF